MAEVALAPTMSEQIWLIAALRWRVFRNALRSTRAKLDLLGLVLSSIMGGFFVLSVGFGLGVASYSLISRGKPALLAFPLLAVFLFWQLAPLLLATSGAAFDFRNLLRFPLRFPVFLVLSLVYGLSDPAAVGSLIWLVCIAWGIALARLELLPAAVIVFVIYAAMNLLLSRAVFTWLERILARRRTREAFLALFLLFLLSSQLLAGMGERWQRRLAPSVLAALPALQMLPSGLAGKALASAAQGKMADFWLAAGLLLGYSGVFALLLIHRLRAQYSGEDLGETQAPTAVARAAPVSAASSNSLAAALLPGRVAALLEKERRYLLRNSGLLVSLIVPLVIVFPLILGGSRPRPGPFARSPEMTFPGAIAYALLIVLQFAHNSFAYDGRGLQLLFVSPVRFRDVLLAKNLTLALMVAFEMVMVGLGVILLGRAPSAIVLMATLFAAVFFTVVHFIVGNWLSLQFPRKFEFGSYRRRVSGATMFVSLAVFALLMGTSALIVLLCRLAGVMWLVPLVFLALSGAALAVYLATLDGFDRFAQRRREALLEQLSR